MSSSPEAPDPRGVAGDERLSEYHKISILGGGFSNGVNCTLNATRLVKEWWNFLHYGQLAH